MKPGAPPVQWKGKAKPSESMARCTLTATEPTGPVVLTTSNTSNTSGDLELTKISQTNYELFKNYSWGGGMISLSGISGMEHQNYWRSWGYRIFDWLRWVVGAVFSVFRNYPCPPLEVGTLIFRWGRGSCWPSEPFLSGWSHEMGRIRSDRGGTNV